jgi:hypothetical protein
MRDNMGKKKIKSGEWSEAGVKTFKMRFLEKVDILNPRRQIKNERRSRRANFSLLRRRIRSSR